MSTSKLEEDPDSSSSSESICSVVYTYTMASDSGGDHLSVDNLSASGSSTRTEEMRSRANSTDSSHPILTPKGKKKRRVNDGKTLTKVTNHPTDKVQPGEDIPDKASPESLRKKDNSNVQLRAPPSSSQKRKTRHQYSNRILSWPLGKPQFDEPPVLEFVNNYKKLSPATRAPSVESHSHMYVKTLITTPAITGRARTPSPKRSNPNLLIIDQAKSSSPTEAKKISSPPPPPRNSSSDTLKVRQRVIDKPPPSDQPDGEPMMSCVVQQEAPHVPGSHTCIKIKPTTRKATFPGPNETYWKNRILPTDLPPNAPPDQDLRYVGIDQILRSAPPTLMRPRPTIPAPRPMSMTSNVEEKPWRQRLPGFFNLLRIVGMEPWHSLDNSSGSRSGTWKCASCFYVGLVAMLLLVSYTFHIATCVRRDAAAKIINATGTNLSETSQVTRSISSTNTSKMTTELGGPDQFICKGNMIYVSIIPSVLHFFAFVYINFVKWFKDGAKRLGCLMEKVSIQLCRERDPLLTREIIHGLRVRMWVGFSWVLLVMVGHGLDSSLGKIYINQDFENKEATAGILTGLFIFCATFQDLVQVAIILTYAVYSYLLRIHTQLIRKQTLRNFIDLTECEKEIVELREILGFLNKNLGFALAPILLIDAIYAGGSFLNIIQLGSEITKYALFVRLFLAAIRMTICYFPLSQGAKVSKSCFKLKDISQDMGLRPPGDHPITALDSLTLLLRTWKLKARIMRIPVTFGTVFCGTVAMFIAAFASGYFIE